MRSSSWVGVTFIAFYLFYCEKPEYTHFDAFLKGKKEINKRNARAIDGIGLLFQHITFELEVLRHLQGVYIMDFRIELRLGKGFAQVSVALDVLYGFVFPVFDQYRVEVAFEVEFHLDEAVIVIVVVVLTLLQPVTTATMSKTGRNAAILFIIV